MVAPTPLSRRGPPPRIIYRVRVGDARCETHRQPASRDALSLFRKSGSSLSFPFFSQKQITKGEYVSALGYPFCLSPSCLVYRTRRKQTLTFFSVPRMFALHDKLFENIELRLYLRALALPIWSVSHDKVSFSAEIVKYLAIIYTFVCI